MAINIGKPSKSHRAFRIIQTDDTKSKTIKLPEIDAINKNLFAGIIDEITAEKNIRMIVERIKQDLYQIAPKVFNDENTRVVENYWASEYKRRVVVDRESAKGKIRRAVECLKELSIVSATEDQIQDAVDKNAKPSQQRVVVEKLLAVLKFLGRTDIKLRKNKKKRNKPSSVTIEELNSLTLPDNLMLLIKVLYFTGMRLGEAFGVTEINIQKDFLRVNSQIDKDGEEKDPKWGSIRDAFITQPTRQLLLQWVKILPSFEYTRGESYHLLVRESQRVLKRKVNFNTLRHSYAINLVSRGIPMGLVAQCLGNSEKVCQEYYAGFQITTQGIETVKAMLK